MGPSLQLFLLSSVSLMSAFAQLDSSELRAKFGAPLDRETFHIPPGFDMVVDYGPARQVCRLAVPSQMPTDDKVSNLEVMNRKMYDFLAALVPEQVRGKELNRGIAILSIQSLFSIEYENVTIAEPRRTGELFGTAGITLTFRDPACPTSSR